MNVIVWKKTIIWLWICIYILLKLCIWKHYWHRGLPVRCWRHRPNDRHHWIQHHVQWPGGHHEPHRQRWTSRRGCGRQPVGRIQRRCLRQLQLQREHRTQPRRADGWIRNRPGRGRLLDCQEQLGIQMGRGWLHQVFTCIFLEWQDYFTFIDNISLGLGKQSDSF